MDAFFHQDIDSKKIQVFSFPKWHRQLQSSFYIHSSVHPNPSRISNLFSSSPISERQTRGDIINTFTSPCTERGQYYRLQDSLKAFANKRSGNTCSVTVSISYHDVWPIFVHQDVWGVQLEGKWPRFRDIMSCINIYSQSNMTNVKLYYTKRAIITWEASSVMKVLARW